MIPITYDAAMMTLFHVFAQLIVLLWSPVMTEGKRGIHAFPRHSTRRPGTELAFTVIARQGHDALQRFVSCSHNQHSSGLYTVKEALA